jgi:predicted peptidase
MLRTCGIPIGIVLVLLAMGSASNPVTVEAIDSDSKRGTVTKEVSDLGVGGPSKGARDVGHPPSGDGEAAALLSSGSLPTGFLDHEVLMNGTSRRYVVYVPIDYSPTRSWPAILFLHGRGESGCDGRRQLTQGLAPAILKQRAAWPFVVIFPQKSQPEMRWTDEAPMLAAILDAVEASYHLDPARRYITGLSQGGYGTLVLATRLPWDFAALATVCGWADDPAAAAVAIGTIPVWAFHGEEDPIVPVRRSLEVVEALRRAGGQPRLTRYTAVGHDAWDLAYGNEDLPRWFLSHHRVL